VIEWRNQNFYGFWYPYVFLGGSVAPCACPPPRPSIFFDYSFHVHHPVNREDRHLLSHAMASDFSVAWQSICMLKISKWGKGRENSEAGFKHEFAQRGWTCTPRGNVHSFVLPHGWTHSPLYKNRGWSEGFLP
jgi:hypothetical protein